MSSPAHILIVNPFGIGDVLFTTPLVRAVRQAFPRSVIGYLCNRRTEPILRANPHLDRLFVYEKDEFVELWRRSPWRGAAHVVGLLRQVLRERFDLVIDLSLGERYGFILKCLGVPRRIGFDFRNRGRFLSDRLWIDGYTETHVVEYYRRLLRFLGIHLLEGALDLRVSPADDRWADAWLRRQGAEDAHPLVGIVPAGGVSWGIGAPFRRWSAEGFARVADTLAERYEARIILFGEPADQPVCRRVADAMRHGAVNLSGQTTLGQFVSLLGRMELVLCNDGGPLHLAVGRRVKTVSVFGPVDPRVYGPYPPSDGRHRVVYQPELPCRPCYHQFKLPPCPYERACLTMITPEEVVEVCDALLRDRWGVRGQPAAHVN